MAKENRYVRLEDWEGNSYYFDGAGGKGSGGFGTSGVDASKIETNPSRFNTSRFYSSGSTITDTKASSGQGIMVDYSGRTSNANSTIFFGTYDNVPLGNVAVTIRLRPIFRDATWFFEENAPKYDNIELFKVKAVYYDNIEKRAVPPLTNSDFLPYGIVTISSLKSFPIVPCMGLGGTGTLKEKYQQNISQFSDMNNFGEVSVVLPYTASKISKNGSMQVVITPVTSGQNAYNPARHDNILTSLVIDNVSISKAAGSIVSAPFIVVNAGY
nr:MAG TPA: hypothetical protein [Caudoviricetes sp.]